MYSIHYHTPANATGPQSARLLYGSGMRLMEAMRLRIQDVDFDRRAIVVRDGKGGTSWSWFCAFPADHCSRDPRSGIVRRHHAFEQTVQRHFQKALEAAGIDRPASVHA